MFAAKRREAMRHKGFERYEEAIELVTVCLELEPEDFYLYCERADCYLRLDRFEEALDDVDTAINLCPLDNHEFFFTKARALAALGRHPEADAQFAKAYRRSAMCPMIKSEWTENKIAFNVKMGMTPEKARSFTEARFRDLLKDSEFESPFIGNGIQNEMPSSQDQKLPNAKAVNPREDVLRDFRKPCALRLPYNSTPTKEIEPTTRPEPKPTNQFNCNGIWAENVSEYNKNFLMKEIFLKFGRVTDIEQKKREKLLFVDYDNPDSPVDAIVFFSDVITKYMTPADEKKPLKLHFRRVEGQQINITALSNKLEGECYFWRTRGCSHGESCSHLHNAPNEGIDLQPYMVFDTISNNRRRRAR